MTIYLRVKRGLVKKLTELNDRAERTIAMEGPDQLEKDFHDFYMWVIYQLDIVNNLLSPALLRLKARYKECATDSTSGGSNTPDTASCNQNGIPSGDSSCCASLEITTASSENALQLINLCEQGANDILTRLQHSHADHLLDTHRDRSQLPLKAKPNDSDNIYLFIKYCISLLLKIKSCAEHNNLSAAEISNIIDGAFVRIRPRSLC